MEVEYINHMGDDLTTANAARVSFKKRHTELDKRDHSLIKYLADHNHFTPFCHCQLTLREKVPIFVARQRFKHTVGFVYSEVSRRYVDDEPEFFIPDYWRKKAPNKKQGSIDEPIEDQEDIEDRYQYILVDCYDLYNDMIEDGVCPEQARMILPQSMYTEYYVTGSLAAWARAYLLRSDSHAQKEIKQLVALWEPILREKFPLSWEALTNKDS